MLHSCFTIHHSPCVFVYDFINVDFLSMTGATCAGATFMFRFAAMSALPVIGIIIGLFQYLHPQKKKLKDIANEIFIMVDEESPKNKQIQL